MSKERVRIKKDAASLFFREQNKLFRADRGGLLPRTYSDFGTKLGKLAGRSFVVERKYGKRVVLKYPKSLVEQMAGGGKVTAIDLESYLTEPAQRRRKK
jgi:hypothetical protein